MTTITPGMIMDSPHINQSTLDTILFNETFLNTTISPNSTTPSASIPLKPIEIMRLIMSVFGLFGNTVSFIVFSRKTFTHLSVSVLLRFLAVLDNCVIIVYNTVSVYHSYTTAEVVTVEMGQFPPVGTWFITGLATASAWTLVFVSIERVTAVCIPFHVRFIFTKKRAIICAVTIIPLSFIANLSMLLLEPRKGDAWPVPESFAILYSGIPSIIIITANTVVIVTMHRRREILRKQGDKKGISIMLIANCVVFVLLTIAFPIYEISTKSLENNSHVRSTLITITGLNHAVNFIFYGLTGSLFRLELKILFCGRCRDIRRPGSIRKSSETGESFTNGRGRISRENSGYSHDESIRQTAGEPTMDLHI